MEIVVSVTNPLGIANENHNEYLFKSIRILIVIIIKNKQKVMDVAVQMFVSASQFF